MRIPFGISSYDRQRGDLPALPVINMVAEAAPTEGGETMLQSRRGLDDRNMTMGAGPVRQLFKGDLVLSSALFGVSGGTLYNEAASIGTIAGSGFVSMAGYSTTLFINAGELIYTWNGSALASITFPDTADVIHIVVAASRLVAIRKDTGKFYWSDPLETDVEALDFATAENVPDRALHLLFIDDILVIFGAETVEFWPNTGSSTLPFQPLEGRVIEKGIRATGCATGIGSSFAWVTNDNQVCLGDENTVISNAGLQERIEASAECRLFRFTMGGDDYLALRIDNETQVYNPRTGQWSEFKNNGYANWLPQCFDGGAFGSYADGMTLEWGSGHTDLDGVLERRFAAGMVIDGDSKEIFNTALRCNTGQTPYASGDYVEPVVERRASRDGGKTWGNWTGRSLGQIGEYGRVVRWNGCGLARYPGYLNEFRVTDPVDWRVSAVMVNERYGG